ncbi:MAG: flagellar assembly protein FliW [Pyrinomonadaceae bacterium]
MTFEQGLIGMPQLKRFVLAKEPDAEPLLWLASHDDDAVSFLVIDPKLIAPDYRIHLSEEVRESLSLGMSDEPIVLAISIIAPEWTSSTANLYAPLVICSSTMRGAQITLPESKYRVDQPLVQSEAPTN